jgi:GIY-YIG catalytic domain/Bacterial regulatory proteins, luxR family
MVSIYALLDNGEPFYIGQTFSIYDRIGCHRSQAKLRRTEKEKRIYDIIKDGNELKYEVLELCSPEQGLKREHYYINTYLDKGIKLVNKRQNNEPSLRNKREQYFEEIADKLLQLIADDCQTDEIGKILFASPRTVETWRQKIKKKYGCKTLGGLMYKCYKLGLIT